MLQGYIKVCSATPTIKVADTLHNAEEICKKIDEAEENYAKVLVLPELCITGYTCSDLFLQELLLEKSLEALEKIMIHTENKDLICFVGLPFSHKGKLYNVAAAISNGKILGLVPKTHIPNYSEFYEWRHFSAAFEGVQMVELFQQKEIPFGTDVLFHCNQMKELVIGVEICEDLWTANPPSVRHALAGATLVVNLSASDETTGKDIYRKQLVNSQSARLLCAYIYTSAGEGESSTDLVFGSHNLISEDGVLLANSKRFENETIFADLDFYKLEGERRRITTFQLDYKEMEKHVKVDFSLKKQHTNLNRYFDCAPFVPSKKSERDKRCEEILNIQSFGLKKRLEHTNCKCAVVGISGGLDSTLALLVTVRAFDMLSLDRKGIIAVTMPCFGTTDRTYNNAIQLMEELKVSIREIDIREAVSLHFRDIGHDDTCHDITYENSQARERTQILMNIANQVNGMVIGTGDMSELALGWATYNGDHMSMYGVNVSVPKTLVRHLVHYYSDTCSERKLQEVLIDVLDTPVSPELLPPKDGLISQKTEDLVGPYELHDFFLYYILRFGFPPSKIYRIAQISFKDVYEKEVILKWLKIFYRRFFSQQFKRSCLPDGPKVGSVAVSPRGDLRMPSDGCGRIWLEDLEKLN